MNNENNHTIIRIHDVIKKIGRSRSGIYQMINEGVFPKPIPLGARSVGWLEADINNWINKKIAESKQPKMETAQ